MNRLLNLGILLSKFLARCCSTQAGCRAANRRQSYKYTKLASSALGRPSFEQCVSHSSASCHKETITGVCQPSQATHVGSRSRAEHNVHQFTGSPGHCTSSKAVQGILEEPEMILFSRQKQFMHAVCVRCNKIGIMCSRLSDSPPRQH